MRQLPDANTHRLSEVHTDAYRAVQMRDTHVEVGAFHQQLASAAHAALMVP